MTFTKVESQWTDHCIVLVPIILFNPIFQKVVLLPLVYFQVQDFYKFYRASSAVIKRSIWYPKVRFDAGSYGRYYGANWLLLFLLAGQGGGVVRRSSPSCGRAGAQGPPPPDRRL